MTITRIIDGKEISIELTSAEIQQAYIENLHELDKEDALRVAETLVEDCGLDPFTDEEIEEAAQELRENLDYTNNGGIEYIESVAHRILWDMRR